MLPDLKSLLSNAHSQARPNSTHHSPIVCLQWMDVRTRHLHSRNGERVTDLGGSESRHCVLGVSTYLVRGGNPHVRKHVGSSTICARGYLAEYTSVLAGYDDDDAYEYKFQRQSEYIPNASARYVGWRSKWTRRLWWFGRFWWVWTEWTRRLW